MDSYFSIPVVTLARGLALVCAVAIALIALLAWRWRLLFRLGLRNIPRRRTQMVLITAGLALSTMLIACALATGDTLAETGRVQVLQLLGRTDEVVTFPAGYVPYARYEALARDLRHDRDVQALVPAIDRDGVVVADMTARQISSGVALLGVPASYSRVFGVLRDTAGHPVSLAALGPDEVYLNPLLAKNLAAGPHHLLYLFVDGRRISLRVRAVLQDTDLAGTRPTVLCSLPQLQALFGQPGAINRILVANAGTATGAAALSDTVAGDIQAAPSGPYNVATNRQDAARKMQQGEDIFTRIFTLFTLFAVSISMLLILLIFTMLAAERRTEMGVTRALGAQRGHLIAMFVFEGAAYDLVAALIGLVAGIGLGTLIVTVLDNVLARFGVQIPFVMTHTSMVLAYSLGALCTLLAVLFSSWWVSRLTLVAAIRGLPETPALDAGLWRSVRALAAAILGLLTSVVRGRLRAAGGALLGMTGALVRVVWALTTCGILLIPPGLVLAQHGYETADLTPFSAGLSLLVLAAGLLLRRLLQVGGLLWTPLGHWADRIGYTATGLGLLAYWVLPADMFGDWGLPRFNGGIEVFFLAGIMMVAGAVWVTVYNVGVLLRPLAWLLSALGRVALSLRTALAYPLHHVFRTGMTLAMFALVIFTLTVMSVISYDSQDSYANPDAMSNGFTISAQTIYTPVPHIAQAMARSPYVRPQEFAAIGTQAYQRIGVIQLSAPQPRWSLYAASVVNRDFLHGTRIALGTRARGYRTDHDVWQALATHPNLAVVDSNAVLSRDGYAAQPVLPTGDIPTFTLSGVHQEDTVMDPTPVWIAALDGGRAVKVTIIGVIDSRAYQTYGLFVSDATMAAAGAPPLAPAHYYFRTAPGRDPERERRRLEAAFLDHGLEATVIGDEILRQEGPRMLVSNMLEGFVGLTLCMGVAALGLVAARSVVERRQQIGMLRALGYHRSTVGLGLLLEAGLVALLGGAIGVALGLVLCRNLFAANFFEQYKSGMLFSVPWDQLAVVVLVACIASLLTTLIPAWQATRIAPAEALRYE